MTVRLQECKCWFEGKLKIAASAVGGWVASFITSRLPLLLISLSPHGASCVCHTISAGLSGLKFICRDNIITFTKVTFLQCHSNITLQCTEECDFLCVRWVCGVCVVCSSTVQWEFDTDISKCVSDLQTAQIQELYFGSAVTLLNLMLDAV